MSQQTETVQKQQLQRFGQLGWVFQRCYCLISHSFFVRFQFFSPGNESVSVDDLCARLFLKFVCYCKKGTLGELVCEQLFFLFQQNSCFSLSFIGIEKLFAITRITYASASDIKSMNSVADTLWTFPKRLLPFLSTDYRSQTSKNGWNFFLFLEKYFRHEKGTVAKPFLGLA